MKFFGWGRKKDPQPIHHEVEKPEHVAATQAARGICSPGISSEWESRDGQELLEGWPRPWKDVDFCQEALAGDTVARSEVALEVDRLQETIRFVFSHEQEGLLAIGTFALDQLAAGVRFGLDGRLKPPAAIEQSCNNNSVNCISPVVPLTIDLRSSDDETDSHQSQLPSLNIPTCKRKELPVFGDRDALLPDLHAPGTTNPFGDLLPIVTPSRTTNSVIIDSPKADTSSLPTFHDVIPEVVSSISESDDELGYSPGVCGLFASRSRRTQSKPGKKQNRKKLPPENQLGDSESCNLKKTNRSKGLSSLGRLWRSGYNGPPDSTELPPTAERESLQLQNRGLPCIANVDLEDGTGVVPTLSSQQQSQCLQKRRGANSFGKGTWACAQNGKWIRTDSEFVVLEM